MLSFQTSYNNKEAISGQNLHLFHQCSHILFEDKINLVYHVIPIDMDFSGVYHNALSLQVFDFLAKQLCLKGSFLGCP